MKLIRSIPTLTFLCAVTVLIIMSGAIFAKWVPFHLELYQQQTEQVETELFARQKLLLKEQVDRAIEYSDYLRSATEKRLQDRIRYRVAEAYDIAQNLYQTHQNSLPHHKLEQIVKDTLHPIRFNRGRGHYFITRLDGFGMLNADRPEMEGRDISDLRDLNGNYIVSDMIAIVKESGEGYYRFRRAGPGNRGAGIPIIAYVKLFEPLNWLIGASDYPQDVEAEIQSEVLERYEAVRFATDGYIFAGRYDGISLTRPARGSNMLETTDANGVKIVRELIAAAKNGGGYVQYVMPTLENIPSKPKISYVTGIPEWQWYVGAGMYLDDIRERIDSGQKSLNHHLRREALELLPIFLGAGLLALVISWLVYTRMRKERDVFTNFFKHAAERFEAIDVSKLSFSEFKFMAVEANTMLAAREAALQKLLQSEKYLKKLADELQSSERYYRSLISHMHEDILVIDRNYKITDVNNTFLVTSGHRRDEVIGRNCYQVTCNRNRPCHEYGDVCGLDMVFKSGRAKKCVHRHLDKNGSEIVVDSLYSPYKDEKGHVTHVIQAVRDVTQEVQIENELRQSEAKYRDLVENSNSIILRFDIRGRITFFNEFAQRFFGYTEDEIINRKLIGTIIPRTASDGHDPAEMFKDIFENTSKYTRNENENVKRSGQRVWIAWTNKAILDQDGKVSEILSVGMDITDRKLAENKLRESEKRFNLFMDNSPTVTFIKDLKGRYIYFSRRYFDVWGEQAKDWIGKSDDELWPPEIAKQYRDSDSAMLAKEKSIEVIETWQTVNGPTEWRIYKFPVRDVADKLMYIAGMAVDITAQRKLEAQLRQAQKMEAIGTFAGGIAHDFNNILSAIFGYTELALDKFSKDTPLNDDLQQVLRAARRARDLVKQILTFSRQVEQNLMPLQVNLIVKEALKFLRSSLPSNIEIKCHQFSHARVLADPTQIHQVMMNLCANAKHAMRENGGILEVSLSEVQLDRDFTAIHPEAAAGRHLKLTVADSGEGMPADVLSKIFDPFYTTKSKEDGTGLGLAVVHGIVKSCRGFISAYSEPAAGSTFNIFLPVVEDQDHRQFEPRVPLPTGSERLLLVDDDKSIAEIGKQMLEGCGYRVTIRTSSVEALELFKAKSDRFDLVITDMTMPNITGDQLAGELISIKPGIPIIMCTGFSETINEQIAKTLGIKGFLMKPVAKAEMVRMVRGVLDQQA